MNKNKSWFTKLFHRKNNIQNVDEANKDEIIEFKNSTIKAYKTRIANLNRELMFARTKLNELRNKLDNSIVIPYKLGSIISINSLSLVLTGTVVGYTVNEDGLSITIEAGGNSISLLYNEYQDYITQSDF